MNEERIMLCERCGKQTWFRRPKINHLQHAVLTVLTAGLWGISWLSLCIGQRFTPWTCGVCGHEQHPAPKAPPKW